VTGSLLQKNWAGSLVIGCDHAGPLLVSSLKLLFSPDIRILDAGTHGSASVDYPDFAREVASRVGSGEFDAGILVCGSGIGMSMTANKVKGVRAALVYQPELAALSRQHNDANVLCLGARFTNSLAATEIIRQFWTTSFEGGRHRARVDKIDSL